MALTNTRVLGGTQTMATKKVTRSVHKKQRLSTPGSAARHYRKLVHFPQAKGKTVEDVEFSTSPDYHNVSINFQDKTALNFSIETGFTLETDYSDWKSGNQRLLRAWRPIRSRA